MDRSLLSILCLAFLMSASTQLAGQWAFDWQNFVDLSDDCLPENFTIAVNSSNVPVNITYYYESLVAFVCGTTNQTFSNLTGPNNGIYSDSFGQQFTYNSSFNFILFTKPKTTGPFLYSTNGSVVPIQDVYYPLFGSWQGINTSNQTACCVPDSVYITETVQQYQGQILLTMNYTSNCSNTTNIRLNSWYSDISTINFGDNRNKSTIDLTFIPSGVNSQMSIIFNYASNTCGFAYQKINTTPLIQGTWLLDWQSSDLSSPSPYQIQVYNNTYMNSTYKGVFNETVNSYVSLNLQGQYYDAVLETGFTYDNVFNTLLSTANKLLYSQNGSLLSHANFANNWANPETYDGDNSTCCIPSYIQLTADSSLLNQLNAIYFYPDGYDETEGCQDFITSIYDGELVTTLSVKTPSLFEVVWSDSIGTKIYWTNPSDPNSIDVSIPGQCNLTMTVTTSPPPNTLSASWISSRVVGFIVGLFVIVSYI